MRTYGRTYDAYENPTWKVVQTDPNGYNDEVWATTLCQCLKLQLGESPFFSQCGLPAEQSVLSQVAPDYNVALTQQQFAPYFLSLSVQKLGLSANGKSLSYKLVAVTSVGFQINFSQLPQ